MGGKRPFPLRWMGAKCLSTVVLDNQDRALRLVQAHGTGMLPVSNLSHWDRERSKETCSLSQGQVIYSRWRLSLSQGQAL